MILFAFLKKDIPDRQKDIPDVHDACGMHRYAHQML